MKTIVLFIAGLFSGSMALAQHEHHLNMQGDSTATDSTAMSHAHSLSLPMNRNGSGTGWLPDASPMYGYGVHARKWMFMFHGNTFIRYNKQDLTQKGSRGDEKFDAPNWFMGMAQRRIGSRGLLHFSSMLSLDPLTIGAEGYPLLFQSGETYNGKRLIDRQHPHDLFSELSVAYTQKISRHADITGYIGYPGEPALGPVAFMHRVSALNNPDAPLGHHWQDATHITFGVATLGIRLGKFKVEGSGFTGREPDENRYDFDKPRFDSYSYRLSYSPSEQVVLQVSRGFLNSSESLEPSADVTRNTASVIHHLPFKKENHYLSTTLAWGQNLSDHEEHSVLLEPTLQMDKTAVYARYEWIQKSAEELELSQFDHEMLFNIQTFTLGASRVLFKAYGMNAALGMQGSLYMAGQGLENIYGHYPVAGEVYLRLYPGLMRMRVLPKKQPQ